MSSNTLAPEAAQAAPRNMGTRIVAVLVLWATAVIAVSALGWLAMLPTNAVAVLVGVAIALPTLWYARSAALKAYVARHGLWWLTAIHVWRIPAALVFFWYGSQQLLPQQFVANAGWGDLAAGLLALGVICWPRRGRPGYWMFHVFGFADFVVAVGTGVTFTVLGHPLMATIATFPVALIPLFGVGVSGATHLMAFHLLWRGEGKDGARAT